MILTLFSSRFTIVAVFDAPALLPLIRDVEEELFDPSRGTPDDKALIFFLCSSADAIVIAVGGSGGTEVPTSSNPPWGNLGLFPIDCEADKLLPIVRLDFEVEVLGAPSILE